MGVIGVRCVSNDYPHRIRSAVPITCRVICEPGYRHDVEIGGWTSILFMYQKVVGCRRNSTELSGQSQGMPGELKPLEINSLWNSMDLHGTQQNKIIGAGNETRTRDLNLGKVALYQLSYSRPKQRRNCRAGSRGVKKNRPQNAAKTLS
jgi:hypothetical protein